MSKKIHIYNVCFTPGYPVKSGKCVVVRASSARSARKQASRKMSAGWRIVSVVRRPRAR